METTTALATDTNPITDTATPPTSEEMGAFINRFSDHYPAWGQFFAKVQTHNDSIRESRKQSAMESVQKAAQDHGLDASLLIREMFGKISSGVFNADEDRNGQEVHGPRNTYSLTKRLSEACPDGYRVEESGEEWSGQGSRIPNWLFSEMQGYYEGRVFTESNLEAFVEDHGQGPFVPKDKRPSQQVKSTTNKPATTAKTTVAAKTTSAKTK